MQTPQHLNAVEPGHDHVQQDSTQPVGIGLNGIQSFLSIFCLYNSILRRKYVGQNRPVDHFVINNKK